MSGEQPSMISLFIRVMKLRVIVLLQITAICAILVHDSLARYDLIDIERTWSDTLWTSLVTLAGGTLSAGGSNAINMWYDRDIDTKMRRTQNRPLPLGQLRPMTVLLFGIFISMLGSSLFFLLHWKAAFWSFFSVGFYHKDILILYVEQKY